MAFKEDDVMKRRLAFWTGLALLSAAGCAPDEGGGVQQDGGDEFSRDADGDGTGTCDPAACDSACLAAGSLGGACRSGVCQCLGTPPPDAAVDGDADMDVDVDVDAPLDEAGAEDAPVDEAGADDAAARTYTCLEGCRNGSEICDDQGFNVPDPYVPMALVCVSGRGGIIYVSRNTGPECDDGIPRCRGWEENGMNAWDYLDYVVQFPCSVDGETHDIDLSAYAGEHLWVGVHDDPARGRDTMMTEVCVATWD
jgi:hypothetical protein